MEGATSLQRLCSTRESLLPYLRSDRAIKPPYTITQISEEAIHREGLRILEAASAETSILYKLGDTGNRSEDNWVVRWVLWHVFRSMGYSCSGAEVALPKASEQDRTFESKRPDCRRHHGQRKHGEHDEPGGELRHAKEAHDTSDN